MSSYDKTLRFLDVPIVEEKEYDYDDMDDVVDDRHNPEDKTIPITVIIPESIRPKQKGRKLSKRDMDELFSLFYDPDHTSQKPTTR